MPKSQRNSFWIGQSGELGLGAKTCHCGFFKERVGLMCIILLTLPFSHIETQQSFCIIGISKSLWLIQSRLMAWLCNRVLKCVNASSNTYTLFQSWIHHILSTVLGPNQKDSFCANCLPFVKVFAWIMTCNGWCWMLVQNIVDQTLRISPPSSHPGCSTCRQNNDNFNITSSFLATVSTATNLLSVI